MEQVRVIRIPELKVVTSGPITNMEEFEAFDNWWSSINTKDYITPRDFMWFNEQKQCMEWVFAIPDGCTDFDKYQLVVFPGGLYAVATSKDTEEDSVKTREEINNWVLKSDCFEVSTKENDTSLRYPMCHVITPKVFKKNMGYHLSDQFIPIVVK
ncbi:MAG: transcription activator effector binding [Anaerocolumna sp.]|jgi:hypothetical protein|nr:transcription activator effector binding [Anaerocolumna sp.]